MIEENLNCLSIPTTKKHCKTFFKKKEAKNFLM